MFNSVTIFWTFCVLIGVTKSFNILAVFPVPSMSHQKFHRPLMQELAKRGHDVVVITTDPAFPKVSDRECPQNLTEIDIHDISYTKWIEGFRTVKAPEGNKAPQQIKVFLEVMLEVFKAQINSVEVQKILNDKKKNFDLLFIDATFRPALSLAYLYNIPAIEFSPIGGVWGTFEVTGALTNHLIYALPMRQRIFNLSMWEKIYELYDAYALDYVVKKQEKVENKVVQTIFGSNIPDLDELRKKVQMIFLNVHNIWDSNRPVPPNIIYLGGINQETPENLPEDIKNYLDSSRNGVIYVNLGIYSPASLLPAEKLKIFKEVFCQLSYDILLQWDKDELEGRCENIRIAKWLPQSNLLKHPKVKLFINQGDLQSTEETLSGSVPSIVIPLLGDQWFNAEQYVKLNIGIRMNMEEITEEKFKNAIERIVNDQTYRKNVAKLNRLLLDQPQSPLQRAVWWTEYVLRHGGARHLQAAGAHVLWTEYYALDLIVLLLIILLIFAVGAICVILRLHNIVSIRQDKSEPKLKLK